MIWGRVLLSIGEKSADDPPEKHSGVLVQWIIDQRPEHFNSELKFAQAIGRREAN